MNTPPNTSDEETDSIYSEDTYKTSGEEKSDEYYRRNDPRIQDELANLYSELTYLTNIIQETTNNIDEINNRRTQLITDRQQLNTQIDEVNAEYRTTTARRDLLLFRLRNIQNQITQLVGDANPILGGKYLNKKNTKRSKKNTKKLKYKNKKKQK